jgi:hypothetical protein
LGEFFIAERHRDRGQYFRAALPPHELNANRSDLKVDWVYIHAGDMYAPIYRSLSPGGKEAGSGQAFQP